MEELRQFPRAEWLDLVRSDQSHRWRQGACVAAEAYFAQLPELRADPEDALVVINGEVLLRGETAEPAQLEEYARRFPELGPRIAVQFEVNRILEAPPDPGAGLPQPIDVLELAGYEFLDEIGAGAAGVVFKARQKSLGRHVAIKVVRTPGADARQLARQRQEAEILARLQHPNIVHIYEVHEARGCLYLVMEFVAGATLADRIKGRPLPPQEAAQVAETLADAVQAVHAAGVLHRDLKPSNVLQAAAGELKITDFGLAKLQTGGHSLTAPDSIMGTPSYMAPEQALGDPHAIGPAADVYSLGAILYELLTGRPPFLGATLLDTLSLIRTEEPVPPRRLQPQLPRDLETICLKCLAKSPGQRYESAAALAADARRFRAGMSIVARRPSVVERVGRLARRKPGAAAAIALLAALVAVLVVAWRINGAQKRRLSDAALVESIATADVQVLPQLLEKLPARQGAVLELIRAGMADVRAPDSRWVNLSVAELTADPAAASEALVEYLSTARPAEIRIIVPALAENAGNAGSAMWRLLESRNLPDEARLKLACLAAQISPGDPRWEQLAPAASRALVWQHPLDISAFTTALRPARKRLTPALVNLYSDANLEPVVREVAAGILARFASDEPATLADLIVRSDASEFRLILPALERQPAAAMPRLELVANEAIDFDRLAADHPAETRHRVARRYDEAQRRRAAAIVAMWRLGNPKAALAALSAAGDPALRAWLIEQAGPLGVPVDVLWEQVQQATDAGVRQGLLLAIGEANLTQLQAQDRRKLNDDVEQLYREDADAGVHGACQWVMENRLRQGEPAFSKQVARGDAASVDRGWYVGPNTHTFTICRGPVAFTMGSPAAELTREDDEGAHERRLDYSFAIGTEETTIEQYLRFRDKFFNRRYSATDDCPANNVKWFDAAAYCRWLSEQAGLPEDQMCYPPVAQIGPGVRLPENWRERTGYRLPTEAEWEYACRGGIAASRYGGEGKALLSRYAWFIENSDDHAWPVGRLKPNNFGLFDMLGNVTERCQDALAPYPGNEPMRKVAAPDESELVVDGTAQRAFRGANFGDAEHNLRSARRNANSVLDEWALVGFRPARRLPAAENR